jgi:hypothetical protein
MMMLPSRSLEQNPENLLCFAAFAEVWLKTTCWLQRALGRESVAEWHVRTHILPTSTEYSQASIHIRWLNGEYINVEDHPSLFIREVTTSNNNDSDGPWNVGLLKSNHLIQLLAQEHFTEFSNCKGLYIYMYVILFWRFQNAACWLLLHSKWEKMSSTWWCEYGCVIVIYLDLPKFNRQVLRTTVTLSSTWSMTTQRQQKFQLKLKILQKMCHKASPINAPTCRPDWWKLQLFLSNFRHCITNT